MHFYGSCKVVRREILVPKRKKKDSVMRPLHTFRGYFYKYSLKKKLYIFQTKLQNTWFKSEKRNKGWLATRKWSDDEMQSRTEHKRLLGNQKLSGYFTPVGGHFTSCALWQSQQCGWAPWGESPGRTGSLGSSTVVLFSMSVYQDRVWWKEPVWGLTAKRASWRWGVGEWP